MQDIWIREQATQAQDRKALDELRDRKLLDREKWLFKYGAEIHSAHNWWPLLWSGLRSPEYTFQDIANVEKGVDFSERTLRYDVIDGSILENCPKSRRSSVTFSAADSITLIQRPAPGACSKTLARLSRKWFGSIAQRILYFWRSHLALPLRCDASQKKRGTEVVTCRSSTRWQEKRSYSFSAMISSTSGVSIRAFGFFLRSRQRSNLVGELVIDSPHFNQALEISLDKCGRPLPHVIARAQAKDVRPCGANHKTILPKQSR